MFPSAAHPFVRVQARASTLDQPARTEWRKYFKGRVRPLAPHANLSFGSVGLQSLEIARITQKQMLAVRMVRCALMCVCVCMCVFIRECWSWMHSNIVFLLHGWVSEWVCTSVSV